MKWNKLFAFFIFTLLLLSFSLKPEISQAYPAALDTCDATGCHLTVRNNEGSSIPGSLRQAIATACSTAGNDLIDFSRYSIDATVISLTQPIMIPRDCRGSIEIAGRSDAVEVVIDGSALARTSPAVLEPALSGAQNLCAIYVNSNNNKIHHFTINGAPFGVCLYGEGNQVSDSYIGVMKNGMAAANQVGVYVANAGNLVLNNVIASNTSHGIVLKGNRSIIQQNYIGVSPLDMNAARGNAGSGIRLIQGAELNLIGGDLVLNANFIRFNGAGGVVLEEGVGLSNKISHNRISRNSGLGIDLKANGVSLPRAGETGPNNMIAMPVDVQVIPMRRVAPYDSYIFRGRAPENYFIEIYLVDDADHGDAAQRIGDQSYGEGDYFLTSQRVNATRDGKFSVTLTSSLLGIGKRVSAIIRDGAGNTSEFSASIELKDVPNPQNPDCGNGRRDSGETCDDGNVTPGDGCSAICSIEPGFTCHEGNPDRCEPEVVLCGNGLVDAGEECDDANRNADDGCAGDCRQEPGWNCTRELGRLSVCTREMTPPTCGDGRLDSGESCDDGNNVAGDGCAVACSEEPGWTCTREAGRLSVCTRVPPSGMCGNGRVDAGEACDDASNACCNARTCQFEPNTTSCDDGNMSTTADHCNGSGMCVGNPGVSITPPASLNAEPTGPNRVRVTFTDNSDNETGFELERAEGACSAGSVFTRIATLPPSAGIGSTITYHDDTVQPGRTYCYRARAINPSGQSTYSNTDDATTPRVSTTCGNGRIETGEVCDDNNTNNSDGCSNSCEVETGYTCSGSPSVCTRTNPNGPPTGLTATPTGPRQVRVTFIDNTDNETGFGIDRADGECRPDSVFTQIGTAPALEGRGGTVIVIDNTVEPGKTYCYRARALTPTGPTAPSNAASATTPTLDENPPPPGTVEGSLQGSGCALQSQQLEGNSKVLLFSMLIVLMLYVFRRRNVKP